MDLHFMWWLVLSLQQFHFKGFIPFFFLARDFYLFHFWVFEKPCVNAYGLGLLSYFPPSMHMDVWLFIYFCQNYRESEDLNMRFYRCINRGSDVLFLCFFTFFSINLKFNHCYCCFKIVLNFSPVEIGVWWGVTASISVEQRESGEKACAVRGWWL